MNTKSKNYVGNTRKLYKLHPDLKQRAISLVESGYPMSVVAASIGLTYRALNYWVKGNTPSRDRTDHELIDRMAKEVDNALSKLESSRHEASSYSATMCDPRLS